MTRREELTHGQRRDEMDGKLSRWGEPPDALVRIERFNSYCF